MTTVIDPGTTGEVAIFNKSGTAILNVALANNFTMTVPRVAGRTIVSMSYPQTGPDPLGWTQPVFTLGLDFEIGDEVWILFPFAPRGTRYDIFSLVNDSVGNGVTGGVCCGVIKVANDPEVLITDGETAATNWKKLSVVNP